MWTFYERCCFELTEAQQNNKIFDTFLNKKVVDFVKLSQMLLYFEPIVSIYKPNLDASLMNHLPRLLKSVEGERLYSGLENKFRKISDYWAQQIKRDLMNQGKGVPEPIIMDRIKESADTLELTHFLKVIIYLSKENSLVKASFWKTNFLFSNFLFGQNAQIYVHIETLFMSLSIICQSAKGNAHFSSENAKKYKTLLMAMFNSVLNLYDVTFDKLHIMRMNLLKKGKDKSGGTLSFLKMNKVTTFFSEAGDVQLTSAATKKRENIKNIKFFKILMYFSVGFKNFIRECSSDLQGSSLSEPIVQVLHILCQISSEVDSMKVKQDNMLKLNQELGNDKKEFVVLREAPVDPEVLQRRAERELREAQQKELEHNSNLAKNYLKNMGNTDQIIYENEQDDDGYVMKQTFNKKLDKKTQQYLDQIKKLQYADEYDDTLEYDDKKRRNQEENKNKHFKTVTLKVDQVEEYDSEDESEDDFKEYDPNFKHRAVDPHERDLDEEETPKEGMSRGANRGNYNRRGRGAKGNYENEQAKKKNNRDYERKQR